ncbi:MAG: glycosyltransferase [Candidatus Bathyarchaeia archaeon]|jgi:glycosyltransferase involved in cell wall biosynthesis
MVERLLVFTTSNLLGSSDRLRGKNVVDALNKVGFEATWYPGIGEESSDKRVLTFVHVVMDVLRKTITLVKNSEQSTAVLIQRHITQDWFTGSSFLFAFLTKFVFKKRLLYDIDDALFLQSPSEVPLLISISDVVLVASHELYQYAKRYNRHVIFMPTCSDREVSRETKEHKKRRQITLGYVGSPSTTVFLREIIDPLAALARTHDIELVVSSAKSAEEYEPFLAIFEEFRRKGVKVRSLLWSLEREGTILEELDIGLAPLSNSEWNKYKGGFKIINYMTAGIPTVASAVGENNIIIENGVNGLLCRNQSEWVQKLQHLIEDKKLRQLISKNARETVLARYSLQANAKRLAELLIRI